MNETKEVTACVAVDEDGSEWIYDNKPIRLAQTWALNYYGRYADNYCQLPKGVIKTLIGRELTWSEEPAELGNKKPYLDLCKEFDNDYADTGGNKALQVCLERVGTTLKEII